MVEDSQGYVDQESSPLRGKYMNQTGTQQPVTVIVSQLIKPGKEPAFEEWMRGISRAAMAFDGHMGVEIIRPADHVHPEYVTIFRFDSYGNLKRWQNSKERHLWLEKLAPLAAAEAHQKVVTGLEYWFTPSQMAAPARPAPYKQMTITWLAIYPLVTLLIFLLAPLMAGMPLFVRTFVLTVILVLLMTYLVMPRMTRLFARWLFA